MNILENLISLYQIREKSTLQSLSMLDILFNSISNTYLKDEGLFTKTYLEEKGKFLNFLANLKQSLIPITDKNSDIRDNKKELQVQLSQFKNAVQKLSQSLSLKNFSGNFNFDKTIEDLKVILLITSLQPVDPSPVPKHFVLENIEIIKVMILKTEIQILISLLIKENKIDAQFMDFIDNIFVALEDEYEASKGELFLLENQQKWEELKSKTFTTNYQNELLSFMEKVRKIILDGILSNTEKQEIAVQFSELITNIPAPLNNFSKIPSLPFLPKSQEEFLAALENKNNRQQIRFLNRIVSGCFDILKAIS